MEKSNLLPLKRFWNLLKPDIIEIKNIYIYAIFSGLLSLSLPLGIQAIVNLIQGGQISASWIILVVVVVLGVALSGILQIMQMKITEDLQQKIFTRSAFEFAYRIPRIKLDQIYKQYAPELVNRFFDTLTVQKGLSKILIDFTAAILQVVFGLLLLSFYHPFFIAFSIVIAVLIYAIIRFTAPKGLETSISESKHKYNVAYWLEEIARAAGSFKVNADNTLALNRTNDHVNKYLDFRQGHFKVLVKQYGLLVLYKVVIVAGLLGIGGILVMEQSMNIGQFIAAEIIILLVISSVDKLILSTETIYDVLTALEKIAQVTDLDLESEEGMDLPSLENGAGVNINFRDVHFDYQGIKDHSLTGLDVEIKASSKIVVVGAVGSGKTALLHLLSGMSNPKSGEISMEGIPQQNLKIEALRELSGTHLEHDVLFEGSVMENITMGRPGIDYAKVTEVMKALNLTEFVNSLSKGLDSQLYPHNLDMPKGEAQKILIARAVAGNPRLLLLDHPLEHICEKDRVAIADYLFDERQTWTAIVVTSDPYMAMKADKTLVMREGKASSYDKLDDITQLLKA